MRMDWIDNVKGPLNISYNFYCMKRILNNIHEKICKHSRRWIFVIKNTDLKLKSGQLLNIPLPTPSSWRVCFLFCQGDDLLQNKKKLFPWFCMSVLFVIIGPPKSLVLLFCDQSRHHPFHWPTRVQCRTSIHLWSCIVCDDVAVLQHRLPRDHAVKFYTILWQN